MNYVPHTPQDQAAMLSAIGASSVADLFSVIPTEARLRGDLKLPEHLSEHDVVAHLETLAGRNLVTSSNFLGAGAYRHYIPAVVDSIISRSEFMTAYTPYQPEVSQGTLQTIFEFQSLMCALTGMDVCNASVYDGGCAAVDGVFMALAITGRNKVVVSSGVHPMTRELLETYLKTHTGFVEVVQVGANGQTELPTLDDQVACVLFQVPNFLGIIEDGPELCRRAAEAGALSVVCLGDPVSLGSLKRPGDYGADIVAGEAQGLGLPPSFGGPYAGFVACRKAHMRRIPGRLCGMTVDSHGKRGYCLTLQAREQHIRREKAYSNICTNQGLCALAVTVHVALIGPQGLRDMAQASHSLASYFANRVAALPGYSLPLSGPHFHEVVVALPIPGTELNRLLAERGIVGGYPLDTAYPNLKNCSLFCFTETTPVAAIDALLAELECIAAGRPLEGAHA